MKSNIIWSRICILSFTAGLLILILGVVVQSQIISYISVPFVVASFLIKHTLLKCPNCGYKGYAPQWNKDPKQFCSNCGKVITFY